MESRGIPYWDSCRWNLCIYLSRHIRLGTIGHSPVNYPKSVAKTEKYVFPGQVNLDSSRVFVYVGKTGFGHEHGVVGLIKQGTLQLAAEQNSGQLVFDMSSFRVDTDTARQYVGLSGTTDNSTRQKANANMRGSDVLDIRKYPTASFTLESSRLLQGKSKRGFPQYQLDGKFTLHGVTRKVSIIADAEPKGGWIHLRRWVCHFADEIRDHTFQQSIWRRWHHRSAKDLGRHLDCRAAGCDNSSSAKEGTFSKRFEAILLDEGLPHFADCEP